MTLARSVASGVARGVASAVTRGQGSSGSSNFDYIGANALGAYDIAPLKSGVTRCFRVRRSSDNTEQDCLNVAEAVMFCGAGNGFITTLYDQNGSNDITQATSTQQPRIVNSGTGDSGLVLDGSNDFLAGSFAIGSSITFCCWANITAAAINTLLEAKSSGGSGVLLRYNDGGNTIDWFPNTGTTIVTATASVRNAWAHFAVTQTGTTYAIYLNGALVGTGTTVSMLDGGNVVQLGRYSSSGGIWPLTGRIRHAVIYSTAKSASEIATIYASVTP